MDVAESSGPSGGCPRPSLKWQRWQHRALNSRPSPSEANVDESADTHSFLKRPLPTLKSSWFSKLILAEGDENASELSMTRTVAEPVELPSNCSALLKFVVGVMILRIRSASASVHGITGRCRSANSADATTGIERLMATSASLAVVICLITYKYTQEYASANDSCLPHTEGPVTWCLYV